MVDFLEDEVGIANDKTILRQFEADEKLIFSTKILKYNDLQKKQERLFVITTKYVHNIKRTEFKRSILLSKIKGLTVSIMSNEFVIHVREEYDYRYSHTTKRDKIMLILDGMYKRLNNGDVLPIFRVDSINLTKFTTTKKDHSKGISRMPGGSIERSNGSVSTQDNTDNALGQKDKKKEVSLADFALVQELGRGGFGTVMLVKKKETGELFALKAIKKSEIDAKNQWEHTKTERMVLENIRHPFLVNLETCFENQEKVYFVMQYMKGGELFKILNTERRFSESRAKFYVAQIALALGHLHANNIIHRDMKPENVLMDENGYVSLADFGVAKVVKGDTPAISFVGTREYLAPEIITEEGHGKEADWWGLGIFTYELIQGQTPFSHENENEMFKMIQYKKIEFNPQIEISANAKDFIEKCLEKHQKQRLGSQKDFEEVKSHPWFSDIDFEALLRREVEPPFKPKVRQETKMDLAEQAKERTLNAINNNMPFKTLHEAQMRKI